MAYLLIGDFVFTVLIVLLLVLKIFTDKMAKNQLELISILTNAKVQYFARPNEHKNRRTRH
jgi:hypothetical protein